MKPLTVEDFVEILKNAKYSPLKLEEQKLLKEGIVLEMLDSVIYEMASKAYSYKAGARSLTFVVNRCFEKVWKEIFGHDDKTFERVLLLEGITEDNSKFILD